MPPDHQFPPRQPHPILAPIPFLPRTETFVCLIKVLLTYKVVNSDVVNDVIVEDFLPTVTPTSPESAASDEIAKGTIASSLSLPRKETFVCRSEVDRTFLGRAIPAIFTGVIRSFFAPAP